MLPFTDSQSTCLLMIQTYKKLIHNLLYYSSFLFIAMQDAWPQITKMFKGKAEVT